MPDRAQCFFVCGVVFSVVVFFSSLGFFAHKTIHRNDPLEDGDIECGKFPDNTTFIKMKKSIGSQWNWKYNIEKPSFGKVEMRCPTFNHDLNVGMNGKWIGRTDGKSFIVVSKINILDCHNDLVYVMRIGDAFQTLINQNQIFVSLELRQDNDVKFYVKKQIFFKCNHLFSI